MITTVREAKRDLFRMLGDPFYRKYLIKFIFRVKKYRQNFIYNEDSLNEVVRWMQGLSNHRRDQQLEEAHRTRRVKRKTRRATIRN